MLTQETERILARKGAASTRLARSLACLKLELPDQVWQDHADAVQEYLEAEREVSDHTQGMVTTLEQRLSRLIPAA